MFLCGNGGDGALADGLVDEVQKPAQFLHGDGVWSSRSIFTSHSSAAALEPLDAATADEIFSSRICSSGSSPRTITFRAASRCSRASARPVSGSTPNASVSCLPKVAVVHAPIAATVGIRRHEAAPYGIPMPRKTCGNQPLAASSGTRWERIVATPAGEDL